MTAIKTDVVDEDRRRLLGAAASAIAALGIASLLPSYARAATASDAIRPFQVNIPEADLDDLRNRLARTRLPEKETVGDFTQGVPLKTTRQLLDHWRNKYDWRKVEARINAVPNFITEIDGLDIHFIHVRSRHENALPLIVTHGWPGSII
ncbi:hypothetical protein GGE12_002457 [Rhizobium mongolense]|uniref:Epoxide hydrolase N-terminal domain-containing protein n=1 Tax=Rhizobium mongolense TaxID=57676 RepID=A0A7W6RMJ8_9HYPH|nr:hypothetical protein [Rhizobium mongolense]